MVPFIENITSADRFLYHYTKSSTAIGYILKNRNIKFGAYTKTNDPKETKSWEFDIGTNGDIDLGKYRMAEESAWLSNELKGRAGVACFSQDFGPLTGSHHTDIFRRGFCKPHMWAHYAENHAGVCLVFDKQKLSQAITSQTPDGRIIMSGPVSYLDKGIVQDLYRDQAYMINADVLEDIGRTQYPGLHIRTHYKTLFFEKLNDWSNEAEWRWVIFSDTDDDIFIDYGDALVGVVFGDAASKETIRAAIQLIRPYGAQYTGLRWKNCSPWYDFGNPLYLPKPWGELD